MCDNLLTNCWLLRPQRTQTIQNTAITLACPPELDDKTLLLKIALTEGKTLPLRIPLTSDTGRGTELELTRKPPL